MRGVWRAGLLYLPVLGMLITSSIAWSQTPCGENGDTDIAAVLSQHLERSAGLMATRGLPPPPEPDDITAFGNALSSYIAADSALLIFSQTEDDYCALLWQREAEPISTRIAGGRTLVDTALLQFAEARNITGAARQRTPRQRGAVAVDEPMALSSASAPDTLRQLSDILLPETIRDGLSGIRHLLIAPSGNIGTIPFSALPLDTAGTVLAERMSFAILPSLLEAAPGYLRIAQSYEIVQSDEAATPVPALGPALVIGDPDGGGDPDWDFPPLPGARAEAHDIATLYGVKPLIGAQATLPAVVDRLRRSPRLIYLAAHGIADPDEPLEGSFVKLSDGRLTALAIQQMTLPSVPVFLSACQTGLGLNHEGGIIGLARAFDIAGAGPVMMSLWNIDDEATRAIMASAVRNLARHPLPEALRLAVLEHRKTHPHEPEKWAAFSVFGR